MIHMSTIKKISLIIILIFVTSCSLSPGMHMNTTSSWSDESKYVSIESIGKNIKIINISDKLNSLKMIIYIK